MKPKKKPKQRRQRGEGGLIEPRPGITPFYYAVWRVGGKQYRKSTGCTGKMEAAAFLRKKLEGADKGIHPSSDPANLHYGDLRKLYLNDYAEQERKSLMKNVETDEVYICGLKHLDKFFGYEKEGDSGLLVKYITVDRIDEFKAARKGDAENGTINRSLAALRRMFSLAQEKGKLQYAPAIKMLPEPKQPRQGFLEVEDYERLYDALGVEVRNESLKKVSRPYAYVKPLLQVGFYTGMRLGEIMQLTWANIDLKDNVIRLARGTTKNDEARIIPMIDGLPEMFEALKRANPTAGENDTVFRGSDGRKTIGSFIKAWRKACIKAAIKTTLNGVEVVSHFDEDGTYHGFLFHDLRRSAIRNLIRAGVDQTVAKKISGHKTDAVFERYNITSTKDLTDAAARVTDYLRGQRGAQPVKPAKLALVRR